MAEHQKNCGCHLCLPGEKQTPKPPIDWEDGYRDGVSEGMALARDEQNTFSREVIEEGIDLDYIEQYLSDNLSSPWFAHKIELMLVRLGLK